jgi:hypothetical protein
MFMESIWPGQRMGIHREVVIFPLLLLDVDVNPVFADLAGEHLGAFPLTGAGAVFEPDVPSVPIADDLAELDDALTQWKSKVRAEVFECEDAILPAEQCDLQAGGFELLA